MFVDSGYVNSVKIARPLHWVPRKRPGKIFVLKVIFEDKGRNIHTKDILRFTYFLVRTICLYSVLFVYFLFLCKNCVIVWCLQGASTLRTMSDGLMSGRIGRGRGLYSEVQCIMSDDHMGIPLWTDRHEWKHYLLTFLVGSNKREK